MGYGGFLIKEVLFDMKDRELQLQMSARENHVKQLAEVEKSYQEAVKQAHDVLALLDQVERNGKYHKNHLHHQ